MPGQTKLPAAVQKLIIENTALHLSEADLLSVLLSAGRDPRRAARSAADTLCDHSVAKLAWMPPAALAAELGVSPRVAATVAAAFELGRRGAWCPPALGERCLDPGRVYELMRPVAHAAREEFHVVMLDVRGRLLCAERVAVGSLTQCPVNPRDALRGAVRAGAHGIVLVHNHPSGDPAPSAEDADLTERLRAASELVGVLARDHVIVAASGYYSFVEAGRWRR